MLQVRFVISFILIFSYITALADDLIAIYHLAVERDPQIAAANAGRDATHESLLQAKAGLLPKINANAEFNLNRQHINNQNNSLFTNQANNTRYFSERNLAISISQPLYQRETSLLIDQSNLRIEQSDLEYQATQQALILRVAERYFDVLAAYDSLETAHAEQRALARQLEQSQQRFKVGIVAMTDVHETQASYDLSVAQELVAENQLTNSQEALREITADYPGKLATLSDNIPLINTEPASTEHWTALSLKYNPSLAALRLKTATLKKQIEVQRSGNYPQLNAVGSVSLQNMSGSSSNIMSASNSDSTAIGLQLAIPIYQGGAVNSRVRQSQADYQQSLDLLEQNQRAIILAVRKSYLGVIAAISQVKAFKQAVISNQSALQATEAGYQVGTRTIVDVLNTQRLLFAAERNYSQARYDYILNGLRLKQATGQIAEVDLQELNKWLINNESVNKR